MLFVVRRYYGRGHRFDHIDYRTAFCRKTISLDEARETGVVEVLNSLLAGDK